MKKFFGAAFGFAAAILIAVPVQAQDSAMPARPAITVDFPDTTVGRLVAANMDALVGVGENAEANYQVSLKRLRAQPDAVAKVLYESYLKTSEDRYFRRWALVETLRELGSNHALTALFQIAFSPVPDEKAPGSEESTRSKESNIRVTAVDGLAEIARLGDPAAESMLARFFPHDDISVRRSAIRGYLRSGQAMQFNSAGASSEIQRRTTDLRSRLSEKDHGLINLAVTDVKTVLHPVMPEQFPATKTRVQKPNEPPKWASPAPLAK